MKILDEANKEGYVLSPFYYEEELEMNVPIIKNEVDVDDLRELVRHFMRDADHEVFLSEKGVVFFKAIKPYHITPEDVLIHLEEEYKDFNESSRGGLLHWIYFLSTKTGIGNPFYPSFEGEPTQEDINDYLFMNPDHIVKYVFWTLKMNDDYDHFKENLPSLITFLKEVTSKEKKYSPSTLFYMLIELNFAFYKKYDMSEEMKSFYHDGLLENAKAGHLESMKMIGYEYYEGVDTFPLDPKESEYYFLKNFEKTKDPEIARTLGYIYYYGRTTNGAPEKEKAFQYFAIGHIAGHYYEATYKLADCYLKGYGTPVCEKAAYNLVREIYNENYNQFLVSNTSKYADVALRLASYYRDGIYVDKDLKQAYFLYLCTKTAIKKRLETIDYVGDTGVAIGISKSIKEIEDKIGKHTRLIKDNGYIINDLSQSYEEDNDIEITGDGNTLFIDISSSEEDTFILNCLPEIAFSEKAKKVSFKIQCKGDISDFIETISSGKISGLQMNKGRLSVDVESEDGYEQANADYEEIIVLPQTLKDVYKQYTLVTLSPFDNGKEYDYLCEDSSVKVGDTLFIRTASGNKESKVLDVMELYEDELPLPLTKMGKAYLS